MSKIKVLFLAANPQDTDKLALDEEIREITSKIRAADYRDSIEQISAWAVRPDDLLQLLNQHKPQIVHFSGHGKKSGEIILTDNNGISTPLSSRALKALFTTLKDNIKVVVLNACYSKDQAEAITQVIDCSIGMNNSIGDNAAITFAASFYRAIGFGRSIKDAFDQGIAALLLKGIPEENTPKLLLRNGVDPSRVVLIDTSLYEPLTLGDKFIEISIESRKAHTSDLKEAIKIWLANFPKPPGSYNSSLFFHKVEDCEKHPLYSDLSNHLPKSGFDVISIWEHYKREVKELDKTKKDLLTAIQEAISEIFPDLKLKFVEFYDLAAVRDDDYDPSRLEDYECSLPRLMFDHLLFELNIDDEGLRSVKTREEYEKIHNDIMRIYDIWRWIEDRVKDLPVIERDNSVIWGKDGDMELIRVPKKDLDSLNRGRKKAVLFFLKGLDNINSISDKIFKDNRLLEQESEQLIKELERSLYCRSFSGECRYLGT